MKNILKTFAVAVLMLSAVAAFAQSPVSRQAPPVKHSDAQGYEVRGSKVYYGRTELRDADYRTFMDLGQGYAKDRDNVWWNGTLLPYVDAASFRLTTQNGRPGHSPGMGPDAGQGMVPGHGPGPGHPGPDAYPHPPMKYEIIGRSVFYNGVRVKGARASSFKDLGWGYGMDTFDVYYSGEEIDASTMHFKVLSDGYAMDAFDVYYCGKEVEGASTSSFKVLGNGYAEDAFDTFYRGVEVE